jgi:hypothetical protein
MIDLETLGTTADAVILSIGAVRFDLDTHEVDDAGFYASISIESNLAAGRKIEEGTLLWWLKQSHEAQRVFHEPKDTLESALVDFVEWFEGSDVPYEDTHVWSNGASFDIPMINHALKQAGLESPWPFHNERCMRTMKNLPWAAQVNIPRVGVQHNALADALHQVKVLQAIWNIGGLVKAKEVA